MFIITQAHIENMFELEFFQVENEMLKRRQMLLFLRVFFLFLSFLCVAAMRKWISIEVVLYNKKKIKQSKNIDLEPTAIKTKWEIKKKGKTLKQLEFF